MAAAQGAAPAAANPPPEDRRATRQAWNGMIFPPIDRDDIMGWTATIEAMQASTPAPEDCRDAAATTILLTKLQQHAPDAEYCKGLVRLQLDWQGLRDTVVADFGQLGLIAIADEYIQLRQGPLALEVYADKELAFLRHFDVDTREAVAKLCAPSTARQCRRRRRASGLQRDEREVQQGHEFPVLRGARSIHPRRGRP